MQASHTVAYPFIFKIVVILKSFGMDRNLWNLTLQEKWALPMAIFAITHGITTGKCNLPTEYPRPRVVGKSLVGN
jgi:hypothetical protein